MLKIAMFGIAGILTALLLKEVKPAFTVFISMAVCLLIFFYAVSKLSYLNQEILNLELGKS